MIFMKKGEKIVILLKGQVVKFDKSTKPLNVLGAGECFGDNIFENYK